MQKNLQSADTIDLKRAKGIFFVEKCLLSSDGPKIGTVNNQVIGGDEVRKNLQSADTIEMQRARGCLVFLS